MKKTIAVIITEPITDVIVKMIDKALTLVENPQAVQFVLCIKKGDKKSYDNAHKLYATYPPDLFSGYPYPIIKMFKYDTDIEQVWDDFIYAIDANTIYKFLKDDLTLLNKNWDVLIINDNTPQLEQKKSKKMTAEEFYAARHGDATQFLAKKQVILLLDEYKKL